MSPVAAAVDQDGAAIDFSSAYQLDRATYFRSTLGLDSSASTTLAAGLDRAGYPDTSWGVPLSKSEAAEVSLTSAAVETLQSRFGPALVIDEMAMAQADSCPKTGCLPPKGGIQIVGLDPSANICTSGFLVRRTDVSPQTLNVLTAGHCIQFGNNTTTNWTHDLTAIGPSLVVNGLKVETWQTNSVADVGLIKVISYPGTRDNLLTDESPVTIRPVYAYELHQYQSVGSIVCRMGRTSYLDCGTILDNDETKPSADGANSANILHTVVVGFDSIGGDSGGPVFVTVNEPGEGLHTYAYGTHVDSERPDGVGKHGWYSPFDYAVTALQTIRSVSIVLCTTTSCGLP